VARARSGPERQANEFHPTIGNLVEKGDFSWMVEPLDYLILQQLPDEGTSVGGLYQLGETLQGLAEKFPLPSSALGGRLRSMKIGGLTRSVKIVPTRAGKDKAWQKTEAGKKRLEAWQNTQAK
jgi:hypothetical protein